MADQSAELSKPLTKGDALALQKQIMVSSQELNTTLEKIAMILEKMAEAIRRQ
jgi:hypothetical protein